MKKILVILSILFFLCQSNLKSIAQQCSFQNPLSNKSQPDPFVTFHEGFYYYTYTTGADVQIRKAKTLEGITNGTNVSVWRIWEHGSDGLSGGVWAPELHFLNGKCYIYTTAQVKGLFGMRVIVLEANNPQDQFTYRGQLAGGIDATILQHYDGKMYMIWMRQEKNDLTNISIAPMISPTQLGQGYTQISIPNINNWYDWEKRGQNTNEGPEIIKRYGKVFLIYSASASWTQDYCLGMFTWNGGNIMDANSWGKSPNPVFQKSDVTAVVGVGHASFTTSPDGKEDWICYHGMDAGVTGWEFRWPRIQRISWNANQTPNLGIPAANGVQISCAGSKGDFFRIKSANFPNQYIRHANSRGRIDANVNNLGDAQFKMIPGLADPNAVSLESVNYPGRFLRHRSGEIWLEENKGDQQFKSDATWRLQKGLSDANGVSFESWNFPGNFIRHRNSLLYSEIPNGSPADATFFTEETSVNGGQNIGESLFIEAEHYSSMKGIQVENCSEGGKDVGYIDSDDWMVYDVIIPKESSYKIEYRVASPAGGAIFELEKAGGNPNYGTITVPSTGNYQSWTTVSHTVTLMAGEQQLAIHALSNGFNINWLKITPTSTVSGAKGTVKVFLMGGQSNMVGWLGVNAALPAMLQQPQNNVQIKVFGSTNSAWGPVKPGLGKDAASFGPEIAFAWDIAQNYPGENIAIIKGAWPATSLYKDWLSPSSGRSAGKGALYDQYVSQVNIAIAELKKKYEVVTIESMCWMQGEDDSDTPAHANAYESNLKNLIKDLRSAFNTPSMPFVIGMIDASDRWIQNVTVRAAEVNAASTVNGVYVFDTHGYNTDGYHYFTSGQLRLGADFASVTINRISPVFSNAVGGFYQDCAYGGTQKNLNSGSYSSAQLAAAGIPDNSISSIKLTRAFSANLYDNSNFGGTSLTMQQDDECLVNETFNDYTSSIKIESKGVTGRSGNYQIKNAYSNLYMDLSTGNVADGNGFVQWTYTGGSNQKFTLTEVEKGIYTIKNFTSGKFLDLTGASKSNGVTLAQFPASGADNQKFVLLDAGNGSYNLIAKHSGLAVEVSWNDVNTSAKVVQRGNGLMTTAQWKLEPIIPVGNKAPTVALTTPVVPASYNAPATMMISADANDADGTVSKVEFYDGNTLLGVSTAAPYTFKWSNATAGTYTLTAKATDNSGATTTSGSITVVVKASGSNQPPTVNLSSPSNGASYNAPATISIAANASDADGTVSKVEFYNGTVLLGTANSAPYSYTWTNAGAGSYTITAKAYDNGNASINSSSVMVTVKVMTTDACSGIAQYVENGNYTAGSVAKNVGKRYQCKEYPYSGWCNGAAWAYAPGTGAYWTDAWTDKGACGARAGEESSSSSVDALTIAPNPVTSELNLSSSYNLTGASLTIIDITGQTVFQSQAAESINIADLNSGIYALIVVTEDGKKLTKRFVKIK